MSMTVPGEPGIQTVDQRSETVETTRQGNNEGQESSKELTGSSDSSSEESHSTTRTMQSKGQVKDSHLPVLRSRTTRIEKFSSYQDDDFELCVMDFNEATTNCGWCDLQHTK